MMEAYASRTGTKRNLAALEAAGWRLMVSAKGRLCAHGFGYALDNGAWTAHQRGEPFDEAAFGVAVDCMGADADFIVAPDIVAGGLASLDYSVSWVPRLAGLPLYLAVQDGMRQRDVEPVLELFVGVFVGGTTEWKERTMRTWAQLARRHGLRCHVGRVNTARRIRLCSAAGAHSFDGSGPSRFSKELQRLDLARRQAHLWGT